MIRIDWISGGRLAQFRIHLNCTHCLQNAEPKSRHIATPRDLNGSAFRRDQAWTLMGMTLAALNEATTISNAAFSESQPSLSRFGDRIVYNVHNSKTSMSFPALLKGLAGSST